MSVKKILSLREEKQSVGKGMAVEGQYLMTSGNVIRLLAFILMMMVHRESLESLRDTGRVMKVGQLEELEVEAGFLALTLQGIKLAASTAEMTCSWSEETGGEQQKVDGGLVGPEVEEGIEKVGDQGHTGLHLLSHHRRPDDTGQWTNSTYRMRRRVNASQKKKEEGIRLIHPVILQDTIHTAIPPNGPALPLEAKKSCTNTARALVVHTNLNMTLHLPQSLIVHRIHLNRAASQTSAFSSGPREQIGIEEGSPLHLRP